MNELAPLLWIHLLQVTIVAGAVLVFNGALVKDRPHLAHMLWALVLLKCITPPVFSSQVGAFCWLNAKRNSSSVQATVPSPLNDQFNLDSNFGGDQIAVKGTGLRLESRQNHGQETALSSTVEHKPTKRSAHTIRWKLWAIVVWLVGAAVCLLIQCVRLVAFVAKSKRDEIVASTQTTALVRKTSLRLGLRRKVEPLITESLVGPAVIGVLRPRIVLPSAIVKQCSKRELEPLIAHELIHVRRGDLWWALLQTIAGSVFWFHPLVRAATAGLSRESERSCDEETIACMEYEPSRYARCLVSVLEQKYRLRSAPALPGVKPIEITSARLERVMKLGQGCHRKTPWWTWLVLLVWGAIVLPGAALVIAQDSTETPELQDSENNADAILPGKVQPDDPMVALAYPIKDIVDVIAKKNPNHEMQSVELELLRYLKNYPVVEVAGQYDAKSNRRVTRIRDGKLHAVRTVAEHQKLKNRVNTLRKHGLRQILVETRFVKCPRGTFKGLAWQESEGDSFIKKQGVLRRTKAIHGPIKLVSHVESEKLESDVVPVGKLVIPTNRDSTYKLEDTVAATQTVEQVVLRDSEAKEMLDRVESHDQCFVGEAPAVVMFATDRPSIHDHLMRPFVTGIEVAKDALQQTKNQPLISVFQDGTAIEFSADIIDEDSVAIDGEVLFSAVEDVKTFTFKGTPDDTELTIQLPHISASRLKFKGTIDPNCTLLVRTENPSSDNEDLILLLKSKLIDVKIAETSENSNLTHKVRSDGPIFSDRDVNAAIPYVERLFDKEDWKRRFYRRCFEHNADATTMEIDKWIKSKAEGLGLTPERWAKLLQMKGGMTETQIRTRVSDEIRYQKLPEKVQRRLTRGRTKLKLDAIAIQSRDSSKNWGPDESQILEAGEGTVIVRTDVEISVNQSGIEFKGSDLEIAGPEGRLYLSADSLRYTVTETGAKSDSKGSVRLYLGEAVIEADSVQFIHQSDRIKLNVEGDAKLSCEVVEFQADRIEQQGDGAMILTGGAVVKTLTANGVRHVGDRIEIRDGSEIIVDGNSVGELDF